LAVPRGFGLDPDKPVTASTADVRWEAVKEDSVLLNGIFTGYKVGLSHYINVLNLKGGPSRVTPSRGVTPDLFFVAEFRKNTG